MKQFSEIKNFPHDASGVNPEDHLWYEAPIGVWYPCWFDVLSPDGFSIHAIDVYRTKDAAMAAAKEWAKGYERQGYYSSNRGRIALDDLLNQCRIVTVIPSEEDED